MEKTKPVTENIDLSRKEIAEKTQEMKKEKRYEMLGREKTLGKTRFMLS